MQQSLDQARVFYAWLTAVGRQGVWFSVVAVLASCVLLAASSSSALLFACALQILLLFPLERFLALRIHFDALLFLSIAENRFDALEQIDHALAAVGLRKTSQAKPPDRPLDQRVQGTRVLVKLYGVVLLLQYAVALGGIAWLWKH